MAKATPSSTAWVMSARPVSIRSPAKVPGYHLMGCILSAASCNKWWQEEVLGSGDYQGEEAKIAPQRLGRNDVYYLPYLMGERSPHNDPAARGTFAGLRIDEHRAGGAQGDIAAPAAYRAAAHGGGGVVPRSRAHGHVRP